MSCGIEGFGLRWEPATSWNLWLDASTRLVRCFPNPDADPTLPVMLVPGNVEDRGGFVVSEVGASSQSAVCFRRGETGSMVLLPTSLGRDLETFGRLSPGPITDSWRLFGATFDVRLPPDLTVWSTQSDDAFAPFPFELADGEGLGLLAFVCEGKTDPPDVSTLRSPDTTVLRQDEGMLELEGRDEEGNTTRERWHYVRRDGLTFLVFGGCVVDDEPRMSQIIAELIEGLRVRR